jgi:hypothetical protein
MSDVKRSNIEERIRELSAAELEFVAGGGPGGGPGVFSTHTAEGIRDIVLGEPSPDLKGWVKNNT